MTQLDKPIAQSAHLLDKLADLPMRAVSVMEIDRDAIAHNFHFLQSQLSGAKCSAVVKADAYGLGMKKIVATLHGNGCEDYYVATLEEGIELRNVLDGKNIYVLGGLLPGTESEFRQHDLIPVLNDLSQIQRWDAWARQKHEQMPAVIHIDTGMWRLGLPPQDVMYLVNNLDLLNGIDLRFIMSHLACSDSPHHNKNHQQRLALEQALQLLPKAPVSFANSHGIFLGPQYQYDQVRPGRSLYGLGARFLHTEGIRQVIQIYARIVQVRSIGKGETVGYDAMYCVPKKTRIATVAVGYADGLSRALSNHGRVYISGYEAPILGRVSMDLITVDVGNVPEALCAPGLWAEIIGDNISADDVALAAGTTSREIIANLGTRYHRIYK